MFVALMLLVQALISGLALGAQAAAVEPMRPGIICSTEGGVRSGDSPAGAPHEPHPYCCMFGCSMVGGAPACPVGAVHIPPARSILVGRAAVASAGTDARFELSPRNTRAPPVLT